MTKDTSYGGYLCLDLLLGSQQPAGAGHDEMLFIIIHQASELWMKLCLHELSAAREAIAADNLGPAFKMLARVARIQTQLIQSWDVLATMTPWDYSAIRPHLGPSSGFQSHQYRLIEFMLGQREQKMADMHAENPEAHALLTAELARPSLYDEAIALLGRRGLPVTDIEGAWATVYADVSRYWDLYDLAEKLVDLEYRVQQWRFAHLKTVERIIGNKRGTGGTVGAAYLEAVLKKRFFPELLSVRTIL